MKYSDQYPYAECGIKINEASVFKSDESLPCFVCGDYTRWKDLVTKAPVCSAHCFDQARSDLSDFCYKDDADDIDSLGLG